MGLVNFVITDAAGFSTVSPKNADTLYFVSDKRRIYKGDVPFSGGIYTTVTDFPGTGEVNTLYINTNTGKVAYWNGVSYQTVVPAIDKTISGTGDNDHLATTKAIVDYVTSQMSDLDVGALEGRVGTLETEMDAAQASITTLTGDGEGSVAKAKADAIATAKGYTDTEVAKKANLEHTHEMSDITGLDTALAGKANSATTLAGYGITDAYTSSQTDTKIAAAVAAAPHLKRTIVEQLPEVEEADENTIYMVGTGAGSEDSAYEEYMLINGAFERIGTSDVDLTNYATKEYADQAEADAISTAATDATQKANTAEQNAKTYADGLIAGLDVEDSAQSGKYVSAVAEVDGKIQVTRADLPAAATLVEGTANGTVKFNGTDVPVHGLGSAAYTESSAYEVAGAAAAAVAALDKEDTAVPGQYVSAVSQEDGVITVQRAALPTAPEITTGTTNGTIKVGTKEVSVAGLKSAAYTEASDYATSAQGAKADSAVQSVVEGSTNGTIDVDGTAVAVHGLGTAAYTSADDYATAEQIQQVITALTWQEV